MVDLSMITKNPAHLLMVAGGAAIAISFIAKGKKVAGLQKKHLQYAGVAALGGGVAMKYLKKNGNGKVEITPAPPMGALPQGALPPGATPIMQTPQFPMAAGPMMGTGGVPLNTTNPGPTTAPGQFPGPILSGSTRALVSSTARKANLANSNTLGVVYGTLSR